MSLAEPSAVEMASVDQRRASDPSASAWVAASAGSGKTKVLTDRVLHLLLEDVAPNKILCLTYTKAAAAEMANRLMYRLSRWATIEADALRLDLTGLLGRTPRRDQAERARQLFAKTIDDPGGPRFETVHAFCQALLSRFPLEAGLPPHFEVLEEQAAATLRQAAQEHVFATAEENGDSLLSAAIATVVTYAAERTLRNLLRELLSQRLRLNQALLQAGGLEVLIERVFAHLGVSMEDGEAAIKLAASEDDAFDLDAVLRLQRGLATGGVRDRGYAARLNAWLASTPRERLDVFEDYRSVFLTKDNGLRGNILDKKSQKACPDGKEILAQEGERLLAVQERLNALTVARATEALLRLGTALIDRYEREKKLRAELDYDDLIECTGRLLRRHGGVSWVMYKLDGGIDHILIDEAQDTSPAQWQMVEALTSEFFAEEAQREVERSIFAVGDLKQSIYSFQGADPAVFRRLRDSYGHRVSNAGRRWRAVELNFSFRSTEAVLKTVDGVFAGEDAARGLRFDQAPISHVPSRSGMAGLVEVWPALIESELVRPTPWEPPKIRKSEDSARRKLAKLLARKIERWIDPKREDPEAWLEARGRRMRAGDILVLVRRRIKFVKDLVRELKERGVPVAGVDRMSLSQELAVMDLIVLGQFLLLPNDDLALATVLRGPLINLSDDDLFDLAYGRGKTSLWRRLVAKAGENSAYEEAHRNLADLMAKTDYLSPFELYSDCLDRQGGRKALQARLGLEARDPIDEFLSLALEFEKREVPSLQRFLQWVEAGEQEIKRDLEQGSDAVRVMTVHGAKGLQAPVVILPDTMQVPSPNQLKPILWSAEEGSGISLPLWLPKVEFAEQHCRVARSRAQILVEEEQNRLLYVAMTRAEDRLYVCGWAGRQTPKPHCWYNLIKTACEADVEGALRHSFDFSDLGEDLAIPPGEGWRLSCAQAAASPREDPGTIGKSDQPLPDWAQRAVTGEVQPVIPLAPSALGKEAALRSPLGTDHGLRFQRGRLIHRLLQILPDLPEDERVNAAKHYLSLPIHGLDGGQQNEIFKETLAVLNDQAFAPLFGPGSRAEVPVLAKVQTSAGRSTLSGQIDRLFVNDKSVLIVDFKTDRPAPAKQEEVPRSYLRQLAAYREAIAAVYPGKPINCALLWTDAPRLMQISDDFLAEYAP